MPASVSFFYLYLRVFICLLAALLAAPAAQASGGGIRERIAERREARQAARATDAEETGTRRVEIEHGGRERWYLLHIPPGYTPGTPMPLVLNLHGGAGNPVQQQDDSGFNDVADANGFIVVYPAGSGRVTRDRLLTWNIGEGSTFATKEGIDDIGFLRAVLDEVSANYSVDPKRVYATGFSQGAFMCYRLACEMSDRIAAIAPVSGVMLGAESDCRPARPVSILHFHGVQDPNVAFRGGMGERAHDKVERRSVRETIDWWVKQNGLPDKPTQQRKEGKASMELYGPNADGIVVGLWTLEDGGHTWPGGKSALPERMVGAVNRDIDAARLIGEFFKKHGRK